MADVERWYNLSKSEQPPSWFERNHMIRDLIVECKSVLDFGCGNRHLQSLLNGDVRYTGVDCVSGSPETVVVDFDSKNIGEWPELERHDVTVCSGVLEYLKNPLNILDYASKSSPRVIVTYVCDTDRPRQPDAHHGWVNRYTERDMLKFFSLVGLKVVGKAKYGRHTIFDLSS